MSENLLIKDAPLIPTSQLTDDVKIPTGGKGVYAVSFQQLKDKIVSDKQLVGRSELSKNTVGLNNVDNTSDLNKPVSFATQKAIEDAVSDKVEKTYVDAAISAISTEASKFYPTLVEANLDIANINVNQPVQIGEAENGGLYYKATAEATSLTKSDYDPVAIAAVDATEKDKAVEKKVISEVKNLGVIHNSNDELVFALLDAIGRRTWLGVGKDGKPDQYTVQCIEDAISNFVGQVAELISKDSISDAGITSDDGQNILFAVTDEDGRKTAFELGMDGKLTEYAATSIADSVGIKQFSANNSLLWALTDADGRRTWLGVGSDGKPDQYTVQCMREALDVEDKVSVLKFCFDGDSMTAGAGSGGNPVTKWFNDLLIVDGITNAEITNFGVGGETSVTICARQGGNPFVVTVDDGVIPTTATPVRVTLQPINGQPVRPMLQGVSSWVGELNGLKGTLSIVKPNGGSTWDEANYYTFTRSTAGSQITANRPMEFHLDIARQNADAIHVIWIGQNGPSVDRAISDAKAMIERIESPIKKYIVISKPTSTDADDAKYFEHFGNRFIAARKYLVQYGLEDAGITPTEQDLTDISNGIVPTSLRSDSVHWLAQGYQILAKLIFNRMKNLGWI